MATINGNDVTIYLNNGTDGAPDWELIVCNTESSIQITSETVDTTTKCDDGVQSTIPGKVSWSISGQGQVKGTPDAGEHTAAELAAFILAGTSKQWAYKNAASDYGYKGNGILTSFEEVANADQPCTYSFTIQGSGALTIL